MIPKIAILATGMLVAITLGTSAPALAHGSGVGSGNPYCGWHYGCGMGPGMMGNWGMGWFGMILMMVFWILVIIGLVFLIKWLIQTTSSGNTDRRTGPKAIDILEERYARGEISKEEFETIKQDLQS